MGYHRVLDRIHGGICRLRLFCRFSRQIGKIRTKLRSTKAHGYRSPSHSLDASSLRASNSPTIPTTRPRLLPAASLNFADQFASCSPSDSKSQHQVDLRRFNSLGKLFPNMGQPIYSSSATLRRNPVAQYQPRVGFMGAYLGSQIWPRDPEPPRSGGSLRRLPPSTLLCRRSGSDWPGQLRRS